MALTEKQTDSIVRLSMLIEGLVGNLSYAIDQDREEKWSSVKVASVKIDTGLVSNPVEALPICLSMEKSAGVQGQGNPAIKDLFVDEKGCIHPLEKGKEVHESIPSGEEHTLGIPKSLWNPKAASENLYLPIDRKKGEGGGDKVK